MSTPLAPLTTLDVGGSASTFIEVTTELELIEAAIGHPHAVLLGSGSNVVISDEGLDAVIAVRTRGVDVQRSDEQATLRIAAGEVWDDVVLLADDHQFAGIEAMAGIPGLVGAAPMQNIGAYGQELSATCTRVKVLDRRSGEVLELDASECGFGYRSSRFKSESGRYVILDVTLTLGTGGHSVVQYFELAKRLGVPVGASAPTRAIASAVRELRAEKGMLLDPEDRDTYSTGSYFTNPIVTEDSRFPPSCPHFAADGGVKLSAAWLIEHAGIEKGWGLNDRARVSTKHTLALTNRGGASANDIIELGDVIAAKVFEQFGVALEREPVLLGRFSE